MKLSSKLPARNGLTESALERDLLRAPTKTRWLIAEVVCGKIETTFDEFGDPYQVATAQVVSGEYITDTIDLPNIRMISRRAFDARRGEDTIPGVEATPPDGVHQTGLASDLTRNRNLLMEGVGYLSPDAAISIAAEFRDKVASDLYVGESLSIGSATIHGNKIDLETGEITDDEEDPQ